MTAAPPVPLKRLRTELRRLDRVVVAFSGGVDSAFLAYVAHTTLGPGCARAVTAAKHSKQTHTLAAGAMWRLQPAKEPVVWKVP